MNESVIKLEWYREVLTLEPGSKVFFPYAKLLVEQKKPDEARFVLEKGLENHPEFIEARLFLIDLLHNHNHIDACGAQVARLASIFATYPGFWEAWGQYAQTKGYSQDFSFALSLLGQMFHNQSLSFMDVLSAGLAQLSGQAQPVQQVQSAQIPAPHCTERNEPDTVGTAALQEQEAPNLAQSMNAIPRASALQQQPPKEAQEATGTAKAAPNASKCSLRTRSMAELLAEQGDVEGAIQIYEELLTYAQPSERPALESRLAGLRSHEQEYAYVPADKTGALSPAQPADLHSISQDIDILNLPGLELAQPLQHVQHSAEVLTIQNTQDNLEYQVSTFAQPDKPAPKSGQNARVMNLLESLAVRLETRVRQ